MGKTKSKERSLTNRNTEEDNNKISQDVGICTHDEIKKLGSRWHIPCGFNVTSDSTARI